MAQTPKRIALRLSVSLKRFQPILVSAMVLLSFLCPQTQISAKGLSNQAEAQIRARYQKSDLASWGRDTGSVKKWGAVLVVMNPLPARADRDLMGLKVPNPVEVDIKGTQIIKQGDYTGNLQQGTILVVFDQKFKDDRVELFCRTADPEQQVARISKIQNTVERLTTKLRFFFDQETMVSNDLDLIYQTIDSWVKPFATHEEALEFASEGRTQEIALDMSFQEVEDILGAPSRKASLGERVLYRYDDMTVEFISGKVSDVTF